MYRPRARKPEPNFWALTGPKFASRIFTKSLKKARKARFVGKKLFCNMPQKSFQRLMIAYLLSIFFAFLLRKKPEPIFLGPKNNSESPSPTYSGATYLYLQMELSSSTGNASDANQGHIRPFVVRKCLFTTPSVSAVAR